MIAADTSSLVSFLEGQTGRDVDKVAAALAAGELVLPPVVVTEVLTDATSAMLLETAIPEIATLDIKEGYWTRAGRARRLVLQHGLKAAVADALIAQSCIDHGVMLIAADGDFRHFAKYCGLKLA